MPYDAEHLLSFQSIVRHTVSVLHRCDGELGLGSGVLIDIADRRFVATAFHCLDGAVLFTDGMAIPHGNALPRPRVQILKQGGDEGFDVGFLEIDKRCLIKTVHEHYPCTLDQLYIGQNMQPGSIIHVCGWPEYGARRAGSDIIEWSLEGVMVRCKGIDDKFLHFEFGGTSGQWNDRGEWIVKNTPSPRGFSGGGCWAITKSKDNELYAPTKNTKLLAIQSEWDTIKVCKAPLIGEWIRVINQHYPHLRGFMLSELGK
jgi:hypothetical protein